MDIYNGLTEYTIPGPALIEGGISSVEQSQSAITATGTATVGNGGGAAPAPTAEPTTTAEEPSQPEPTTEQPVESQPQPTAAPSTLETSTRAAPTTTEAPAIPAEPTTEAPAPAPTGGDNGNVGAQSLYGQCGGINWTGATACAEGTCKNWNPYYSQCVNEA